MKKNYAILFLCFITLSITAQTPYASYPLDGNANDVAGNNLHGTITGSPITTSNRYLLNGKALQFDGASDYIDLPTDFDFPNRTIIGWFNVTQVPSGGNGNVIYNSDHNGIQYGSTGAHVLFLNNTNTLRIFSGQVGYNASVNTNTWYQFAIVRTPNTTKFFVNGALVYSGASDNSHSTNGVSNAVVGADRIHGGFTDGKIDDLSIYDVALTDAQIGNVYTSIKEAYFIDSKLKVINSGNLFGYTISEEGLNSIEGIELVDVNGRVINTLPIKTTCIQQANDLSSGVYFMKFSVIGSSKPLMKKIVITTD